MSPRLLLVMLVATALAFAPFAMPMGEAIAAPAGHHESMAKASHCDEMPSPAKSDKKKEKPCCVAGCMAAAMLPAMAEGAVVLPDVSERPALDRFYRGYLGEIATPPPRRA